MYSFGKRTTDLKDKNGMICDKVMERVSENSWFNY